jgi:hypothetical protein
MAEMYDRIRAAQKFSLSKEFATAADGLVDNYLELYKVAQYCRLPYPATWIEWLHDDRPHWDSKGPHKARPVDPSRHQTSPQRVALLLEQQGDFAGKWKAHLFWSSKDIPTKVTGIESRNNGSLAAVMMDISKILQKAEDYNPEDGLDAALGGQVVADFGMGLLSALPVDIVKRLGEYASEDWGGEIRFMVAVLGLLNTRNVVEIEAVDKTAHNKKRKKQKKPALFSHKILKVRRQLLVRSGGTSDSGDHRNLRRHFVMGHFKHRKTGLFYWSFHMRGKLEHGAVEKDYEVEV